MLKYCNSCGTPVEPNPKKIDVTEGIYIRTKEVCDPCFNVLDGINKRKAEKEAAELELINNPPKDITVIQVG